MRKWTIEGTRHVYSSSFSVYQNLEYLKIIVICYLFHLAHNEWRNLFIACVFAWKLKVDVLGKDKPPRKLWVFFSYVCLRVMLPNHAFVKPWTIVANPFTYKSLLFYLTYLLIIFNLFYLIIYLTYFILRIIFCHLSYVSLSVNFRFCFSYRPVNMRRKGVQ